jgi:hypothetical protein
MSNRQGISPSAAVKRVDRRTRLKVVVLLALIGPARSTRAAWSTEDGATVEGRRYRRDERGISAEYPRAAGRCLRLIEPTSRLACSGHGDRPAGLLKLLQPAGLRHRRRPRGAPKPGLCVLKVAVDGVLAEHESGRDLAVREPLETRRRISSWRGVRSSSPSGARWAIGGPPRLASISWAHAASHAAPISSRHASAAVASRTAASSRPNETSTRASSSRARASSKDAPLATKSSTASSSRSRAVSSSSATAARRPSDRLTEA